MNALVLVLATLPAPQDAAAAKVEEQVLASVAQNFRYFVSPRGCHAAAVSQKGSRFVVLVDGAESPKFDEVHDPVVFSPDGSRYAYWARTGQEAVVVVDGKELVRIQLPSDGNSNPAVADLAFTSSGKHVWFTEHVHKSNNTGDDFDRIVFDGEAQISGGRSPVFSPDG